MPTKCIKPTAVSHTGQGVSRVPSLNPTFTVDRAACPGGRCAPGTEVNPCDLPTRGPQALEASGAQCSSWKALVKWLVTHYRNSDCSAEETVILGEWKLPDPAAHAITAHGALAHSQCICTQPGFGGGSLEVPMTWCITPSKQQGWGMAQWLSTDL